MLVAEVAVGECLRKQECILTVTASAFATEIGAMRAQERLPVQEDAMVYSVHLSEGGPIYLTVIFCGCLTKENSRLMFEVLLQGRPVPMKSDLGQALGGAAVEKLAKSTGARLNVLPKGTDYTL